jgi:hypothetical protein
MRLILKFCLFFLNVKCHNVFQSYTRFTKKVFFPIFALSHSFDSSHIMQTPEITEIAQVTKDASDSHVLSKRKKKMVI